MRHPPIVVIPAVLLYLLLGEGAYAQAGRDDAPVAIAGVVIDQESGDPIPGVSVRFIPQWASHGPELMTDASGRFAIARMTPGLYTVRFRGLGYGEVEEVVDLVSRSEARFRVELVPEALALEPLVVVAQRRVWSDMQGFETRRERGWGQYVTREEIERWNPLRPTDLLLRLRGIEVVSRGQWGTAVLMTRGSCEPMLVVDGVPLSGQRGINPETQLLDQLFSPADIEAIEVYSAGRVPVQFGMSTCGAIIVWTRRPDPGQGGGSRRSFWAGIVILALISLRAF
jgi:hypothetical protein